MIGCEYEHEEKRRVSEKRKERKRGPFLRE